MKTYDCAVIGAGVFGSWTAYWLAREGHRVMLIDAYGPANNRASSGGESRIIRMSYGADEVYTRFSFRALSLWKAFAEETGQPLFHKTGALFFSAADHPAIEESIPVLKQCGVPFEELSFHEIRQRYPQIHFDAPVRGVFEPESGALMARRSVQAVVERARQLGVDYRIGKAASVSEDGLKLSSGETIRAGTCVFACGPWLPKVFPDLLGSRIFPTRQEVFFFGLPSGDRTFSSDAFPVWLDRLDDRIPYGFPDLESRGFKLAFDLHGPEFDPDTGDRFVDESAIDAARRYIAGRFPALAGAPLVESRVCQYENTSNGDFVIDRHPDYGNVWIAGGGSGHGFKHGPAVGEYVATRIANRGKEEPRFSLSSKDTVQHRQVF